MGITDCTKCNFCTTRKKIINGIGPTPTKLMIVGSHPNDEDELRGVPFSGQAGRLIEEALNNACIKKSEVYITYALKCQPSKDSIDSEIQICSQYLEDEIYKVKPQIIMALGNVALKYLKNQSNIVKYHGKLFNDEKRNCKIFAAYHPSFVLKQNGGSAKERFFDDIKKLYNILNQLNTTPIENKYIVVDNIETAKELMERLKEVNPVAIDIETTGLDFINDKVLGISFSWKEHTGVYFPLLGENGIEIWKPEEKEYIVITLASILKDKRCILHNAKFDLKFLDLLGIKINNFDDTLIAYYLLDENKPHGLKDLARDYFSDLADYETQAMGYLKSKATSYSVIPTAILGQYAAADTDCTLRLYNKSLPELQKYNFLPDPKKPGFDPNNFGLYKDLMIPLSKVLRQVELTGVRIDTKYMEELGIKWKTDAEILKKKLDTMSGGINIKSSKQLGEYLFKTLKLEPVKQTKKGGDSTDAQTLTILAAQSKDPESFPSLLLKYKELYKLISVYIEGMTPLIDKAGRIHTNYNLTGTVTGRLSSSNPNLQNIPRREEARKIFVAEKGHKLIMCDYSQIELRIFACYTNDPDLVDSFKKNEDIHTRVASQVLGIPPEQITKEQRVMAKTVNFGLIYGRGPRSVAEQLNISEEEAKEFIAEYFQRYKTAAKWMATIRLLIREKGQVQNIFKRIRRIPEIFSGDFKDKATAERQAINSIIQGTASDCVNLSAIRIDNTLKQRNLKSKLVLLVHDELVYEVPDNEIEEMKVLLKEQMEKIPHSHIIVPLTIDMEISDTWQ